MSGTRVLSSPLQLQGVLGTSDSGKSCRAYSSLNKQGCQTCPDTRNNFDACRWRTRVVSEVEYWWKRAYDHCKLTWNSFKTHQNNILHSLTSKKEAVFRRPQLEDAGAVGYGLVEEGWWSLIAFTTEAQNASEWSLWLLDIPWGQKYTNAMCRLRKLLYRLHLYKARVLGVCWHQE